MGARDVTVNIKEGRGETLPLLFRNPDKRAAKATLWPRRRSTFLLPCRTHGLVYKTSALLGMMKTVKETDKTETGKIPGDLWQCLPSLLQVETFNSKKMHINLLDPL